MQGSNSMFHRRLFGSRAAMVLGGIILIAGCEPIRQTHGYIPAEAYVNRVQVGTDSRSEVMSKIGRPSTIATFDNKDWYYIQRSTKTVAFYAPEVEDQQVLVVAFDENDIVASVDRFGLADGQIVNLVTRTTPTRGKRLTFLQQLMGNLGRIGPGQITGDESLF